MRLKLLMRWWSAWAGKKPLRCEAENNDEIERCLAQTWDYWLNLKNIWVPDTEQDTFNRGRFRGLRPLAILRGHRILANAARDSPRDFVAATRSDDGTGGLEMETVVQLYWRLQYRGHQNGHQTS